LGYHTFEKKNSISFLNVGSHKFKIDQLSKVVFINQSKPNYFQQNDFILKKEPKNGKKKEKLWKTIRNFFASIIHMFTTLSCSKYYFDLFINFKSFSINYTKLKGDLQPTLRLLGEFLITNIYFFKLIICNDIFLDFLIC